MNKHNLFIGTVGESKSFAEVLAEVQGYMSAQYSSLLGGNAKAEIQRITRCYLQENGITVEGYSNDTLLEALYTEMAGYSILTRYLEDATIEEININAWNDIEIIRQGGELEKVEERFSSPEHATSVIRRMLNISGMILDNAQPLALGSLGKNIRISAIKSPIVDSDVGVAASIRIVNQQNLTGEDFIRSGTATTDMLKLLTDCIRFGVSTCIAGATGSGKTTLAGWLLTTIPNHKRIYTIESGSREMSLQKVEDGRVVNSVIHTITRPSDDENQSIDQTMLVDMSLRLHPDYLVVSEMRGPEAHAACEASATGHTVVTTTHSADGIGTWGRVAMLIRRGCTVDPATSMEMAQSSFPLVVYCKQLENRQRKITAIVECERLPDNTHRYRTLYRYRAAMRQTANGDWQDVGCHEQVEEMSDGLRQRLIENGWCGDKEDVR